MWETSFPFCACKRDCVRKAAFGRWRDECYFARGGKVTKTPPGNGSEERLRGAGAHSHLSPGPPIYGSVSLWMFGKFRRPKF